jgi:hypothetical protein
MWPVSDIFTIASVVKNALSTAPMLMYQHFAVATVQTNLTGDRYILEASYPH